MRKIPEHVVERAVEIFEQNNPPVDLDGGLRDRAQQREDNKVAKATEWAVSDTLERLGVPHEWDETEDDPTGADILRFPRTIF